MKTTIALLLTFLAVTPLFAPPGVLRTNITLAWIPANTPSTNFIYKIYSSTNILQPPTNWSVYATASGSVSNITLPIDANQRWFVMTASNWWGESSFSNVASTPPIPRYDQEFGIGP
jgi:hypothetical protein